MSRYQRLKAGGIMPTGKKSTYSGQTDARREASARYLKEKVEDIRIRVPKGRKEVIQAAASVQGESVNGFISIAIDERMERLNGSEVTE